MTRAAGRWRWTPPPVVRAAQAVEHLARHRPVGLPDNDDRVRGRRLEVGPAGEGAGGRGRWRAGGSDRGGEARVRDGPGVRVAAAGWAGVWGPRQGSGWAEARTARRATRSAASGARALRGRMSGAIIHWRTDLRQGYAGDRAWQAGWSRGGERLCRLRRGAPRCGPKPESRLQPGRDTCVDGS